MKKLYVVGLLAMVLAVASGESAFTQRSDKAALEKLLISNERRINAAIAKSDKAAFLALVADDAAWLSGGQFVPAPLFAEALEQIKLTASEVVNPQVVWADDKTGVVVYAWNAAGTVLNTPAKPQLASTVWTLRGGKWVVIHHHESELRQ